MANEKAVAPFQAKMEVLSGTIKSPKFMAALAANASKYVRPEKMAQMVITAASITPGILDCTPVSIMRSVLVAASIGLEIGPALGHAYLVPFGKDCQLIVGYRGVINLVTRNKKVLNVTSRAVFDCDEFDVQYGTDERIYHKPPVNLVRPPGTKLIATYAVATLANGAKPFHVSNREEIDDARERSKARNSPWDSDFVAMARKTAVLRLGKYLPMDGDMANAVLAEEAADRGEAQGKEFLNLHDDDISPPPTTAQAVKARLAAVGQPGSVVDADDIPNELR